MKSYILSFVWVASFIVAWTIGEKTDPEFVGLAIECVKELGRQWFWFL